jgi:hypothetical protein
VRRWYQDARGLRNEMRFDSASPPVLQRREVMRSSLAWQAGLATLALGLLTARGVTTGDEAVHLDLAHGIAARGETTLSIDPGDLWVPSRPEAGGLFYQAEDGLRSASSPAMAWLAVPLVAVASPFAPEPLALDALFRESDRPVRAVLAPIARDPRAIAFTLLGPICAALAVLFLVLAGSELGASRRAIVLGALALGLASPLFVYAGTCWTQLPTTALLSFVLWRTCARAASDRARAEPIAIGFALAVLVRPEHLALIVPLCGALYVIEKAAQRSPISALASLAASVGLVLALLVWWGTPMASGGLALSTLARGVPGLLLSLRTGLFVYAPFTMLALFGIAKLHRRSKGVALLVGGWTLVAVLFYGAWFDWSASIAYGPRFLVPVLPGLALALVVLHDDAPWSRAPIVLALIAGFSVSLPGALVAHVRIDEAEAFLHPTFLSAWRALGRGVDSLSTFVPAYGLLALIAALLGLAVSFRSRPRSA